MTQPKTPDVQCPTTSPPAPLVALVGHRPSDVDVVRKTPLAGLDGRTLIDHYLQPLGLAKHDVALTHVVPHCNASSDDYRGWVTKEIERLRPSVVIALGAVAKAALGPRAHFTLPHPAALRRHGDRGGEMARKMRGIQEAVGKARRKLQKSVHIAKIEDPGTDLQVVYGVVLDPYQYDTQGDWVPAWDIQQTAHNFILNYPVVGFMHCEPAQAAVVESFIWPYPSQADYAAAMDNQPHRAYASWYGSDKIHSGAWILGVKVFDGPTWALIKAGELAAYSIGGTGVRIPLGPTQALPQVEYIVQGIPPPGVDPDAKAPSDEREGDAPDAPTGNGAVAPAASAAPTSKP